MQSVLGITVPDELLPLWREWFAPARQPFSVTGLATDRAAELLARASRGSPGSGIVPSAEVRDTFQMYDDREWIWLVEEEFNALPLRERRALLRIREPMAGRLVWWPSLLAREGDRPILNFVAEGLADSRHEQVTAITWERAGATLPGARALAGTFPGRSGPNCFGTVMAAAGLPGADDEWMLQQPFECWLAGAAEPVRGSATDDLPGVVLVWREAGGLPAHAAVTIGDGYAVSKPSQAWCSPRVVWTVRETIAHSRRRGCRLSRYRLG